MPVCTELNDWIWDAERDIHLIQSGLQLQPGTGSCSSSPSHSIERVPHMTYFLVWGRGKQAGITRLHCTCWALRATSWSGKSPSGGGPACQSALYGGGGASGGRSRYREYGESRLMLSEAAVMRVQHQLCWCWHWGEFYIGFDAAGGMLVRRDMISKCVLSTLTPKADMPLEMM